MQISYNHAGSVDIFKPARGLNQFADAGLSSTILDFSAIVKVFGKKEIVRLEKQEQKPKQWVFREHPEKLIEVVRQFVQKCRDCNIAVSLAVLPSIGLEDECPDAGELYPLLRECMRACGACGIRNVVVQPLQEKKENRQFLEQVFLWAKQERLHVLLRNCPKYFHGRYVRGTCCEAAELKEWLRVMNEQAGERLFGCCVDLGTCHICGQNVYEFAVALGEEIEAIIIDENDGEVPGTLLPFSVIRKNQNRTDWLNFFTGLRVIGFDGTVVLDMKESVGSAPHFLRPAMLGYAGYVGRYLEWQLRLEQQLDFYPKRVLFGAGNMCRNYMKCYGKKYPPLFTCDNNAALWGTQFEGLEVKDPEKLRSLPEDCAIFICNIYYDEIQEQLVQMGVTNPVLRFNDEFLPLQHKDRFDV